MIASDGGLSVRVDSVGGDVADAVGISGATPSGRGTLLILVHGYNVTEPCAVDAFMDFRNLLAPLAGHIPGGIPYLGKYFWPGDADWGFLSFGVYPWAIRAARRSARRLVAYLSKLSGPGGTPVEVHLVGHSLGCRLVLEALSVAAGDDQAKGNDRDDHIPMPSRDINFGHIVLMAGAVPSALLERDERLVRAGRTASHRTVMFSQRDTILRLAFPPGQWAGAVIRTETEGIFTRALGLNGSPETFGERRVEMTGNKHGAYWSDPRATYELARLLGAALDHVVYDRSAIVHDSVEPYKTPEYATPSQVIATRMPVH